MVHNIADDFSSSSYTLIFITASVLSHPFPLRTKLDDYKFCELDTFFSSSSSTQPREDAFVIKTVAKKKEKRKKKKIEGWYQGKIHKRNTQGTHTKKKGQSFNDSFPIKITHQKIVSILFAAAPTFVCSYHHCWRPHSSEVDLISGEDQCDIFRCFWLDLSMHKKHLGVRHQNSL